MIPFFDYRPEYRAQQKAIDAAIRRVLESGRLILGPEVEAFESEFAAFVGASSAIGVANGTDAIEVALRALEIGPGHEVLTVANAGVPPVAAIRAVGATPRFVDVDAASLVLDAQKLEEALGPRTRCIVPVHLYGCPAPMEPILDLARRHGLAVIEDCAQAHGTRYRGRHAGTLGTIGCFSFYPTKNLGAYGDGGACVTSDPALAERMRRLRMYGFAGDRHAHLEGINSRLDELQAAVLRVKLQALPQAIEARRQAAARYRAALTMPTLELQALPAGCEHAYHLFVVRARQRDALCAALGRRDIGFGLHYPEPVHRMRAYRDTPYGSTSLPVTERACDRVLSLPLYPGLDAAAQQAVVEALRSAPTTD